MEIYTITDQSKIFTGMCHESPGYFVVLSDKEARLVEAHYQNEHKIEQILNKATTLYDTHSEKIDYEKLVIESVLESRKMSEEVLRLNEHRIGKTKERV